MGSIGFLLLLLWFLNHMSRSSTNVIGRNPQLSTLNCLPTLNYTLNRQRTLN
jgi:hypothetical protein